MTVAYFNADKMPTTVIRFPNTVGAGEFLKFAGFYMSNYKTRPEVAPLWDGKEKLILITDENGRSWKKHMGDVRDVVHGLVCALGKQPAFGQIIQLGGPEAFTWDKVVPHLSKRIGMPYVTVALKGTPSYYEFDLTKARTLIGFKPQYDGVRMIDDALAFSRGQDIGVLPT